MGRNATQANKWSAAAAVALVLSLLFSLVAFSQQPSSQDEFNNVMQLIAQGKSSAAAARINQFLKDNPKDPAAPDFAFQLGRAYEQLSRWADAEQAFRRFFAEWPKDPRVADAIVAAAQNAARDKRRQDAIQLYEDAIDRYPDVASVMLSRFDLASLYEAAGRADAAAKQLSDLAKRNGPYSMRAAYDLIQLYIRQGNTYEAETALANFTKQYPDDDSMKLTLGQFYLKQGKPEQAVAVFDALVAKQLGNTGIEGFQFQAYKEAGKLDSLIASLQREAKKNPNDLTPIKKLKRLYIWNNDTIGALDYLEKIVEKEPDNADDAVTLARFYYLNQWKTKARETLAKLLEKRPELSMAWEQLGNIEYSDMNYDKARAAFEKAARFDPEDPQSYRRLVNYYWQFGSSADVSKIFEDGRAHIGRRTLFCQELAELYYRQMRFKDSLDEYLKAVADNPGEPRLRSMVFDLLNRDELKADGYTAVMQASRDFPQNVELNMIAAEVMMSRGEKDAAVKKLEQMSAADPDSEGLYSLLGQRLSARGEAAGAAAMFELAADREHGDAAGRLIQAGRAWQSAGDAAAAERDYTRIIDTMPDSAAADEALYRLAGIAKEKNDYKRVRALYSQLVSQYPLSPYAGESYVGEAVAALRLGDFDKARAAFDALSENPRTSRFADEIFFYRAELRLLDNKKDEARSLYKRVVDQYPESARVADSINRLLFLEDTDEADPINVQAYLEAEKRMLKGDMDGAEGMLRGLAVSLPEGPLLAYVQFRTGELLDGEKRYTEAAEFYKLSADGGGLTDLRQPANVKLAGALMKLGKTAEALKRYQMVVTEDPRGYWAQLARAEAARIPPQSGTEN